MLLVLVARQILLLFAIAHRAFYPVWRSMHWMVLARECDQQTRLGAILNETGDVISDIALYLPFLFLPESNALLVNIMLFCTILTEFCGLSRRRLTVFAVLPVHLAKAIAR